MTISELEGERLKSKSPAQGSAKTLTYDVDYRAVLDERKIKDCINHHDVFQRFSEEEILKKQRAIIDGKVSLFGLLAFGKGMTPKEIVTPTINITVTLYPQADRIVGDASLTYTESREFNGCVIDQFEDAVSYIKSKLPIRGIIGSDGKRRDYLAIPEIAIREALANAIVHCDYAASTPRIQVDIYANRIEIIRQTIRKIDLQTLVFENASEQLFKINLFTSASISEEDRKWLKQFNDYELKDRQLNSLIYLKHHNSDGINNSTYRKLNGMNSVGDDKMANRELVGMVKIGILKSAGVGRYRKYHLK